MAAPSFPPSSYWQRVVYILMPLILLLLFLGVIHLWGGEETAVSIPPSPTPPATPTSPPTPTETATGKATTPLPPTPTNQPTIPLPAGDITLLGPPASSTFPINTIITLFWQWPYPLTDGQQFSVYWQQGEQIQLLGQITEPNFGDLFQLQTRPTIVGNAVWWVVLDNTSESEQQKSIHRQINVIDN